MTTCFSSLLSFCIVLQSIVFATRNSITLENEKQGTPSNEWDINGAGDHSIEGYAVPFGVSIGESVELRINTSATKWRIDIYRVGYYQGNGARKITTFTFNKASIQPNCIQLLKWRTVTCNNWSPTYIFQTSDYSLISGVYFARLTRLDITDTAHPHYNWRVDNSMFREQKQFCDSNCYSKPSASLHSYGASGYGQARHKLKEAYASHIYFIIRDDNSNSDILMQTSDTTWMAYNRYGGASSYGSFDPLNEKERGLIMSYNRPIVTRDYRSINTLWSAEYPAIRYLEKNGFDVSYISGLDMSNIQTINQLIKHKVFLSVGHDEYWSFKQRNLIKKGIKKYGLHVMFWSGNEMYWKIRFENDKNMPNNDLYHNPMMVIYKETRVRSSKLDKDSNIWTGTWRDEHNGFKYEDGPWPENEITGQLYTVDVWRADPIHIPWYFARHKIWRNCDNINKLNIGDDAYILSKPLIGHEFDEDIDNGYRPVGLQHLTETTIDNVQYLYDWGIIYETGTAQHHLTFYKHKSGSLVFAAGSIIFSWGLDDNHDSATGIPPHLENYYDCRVLKDGYGAIIELQQAMFNLFADMNVNKPETMDQTKFIYQKSLIDNSLPTSWININTEIIEYESDDIHNGLRCIRIEGSSKDNDGNGIIGGIEIFVSNSYIDGVNWNNKDKRWYAGIIDYDKITLKYNDIKDINEWYWYFEAWIDVNMNDKLYILSRAVDDSGNIQNITNVLDTGIDVNNLKQCIYKQWIWRKRPILSKHVALTKTEL